jgi:hypothetical protein
MVDAGDLPVWKDNFGEPALAVAFQAPVSASLQSASYPQTSDAFRAEAVDALFAAGDFTRLGSDDGEVRPNPRRQAARPALALIVASQARPLSSVSAIAAPVSILNQSAEGLTELPPRGEAALPTDSDASFNIELGNVSQD